MMGGNEGGEFNRGLDVCCIIVETADCQRLVIDQVDIGLGYGGCLVRRKWVSGSRGWMRRVRVANVYAKQDI